MADEFRYALLVLGLLALAGVLLHGFWSVRRKNQETEHRFYQEEPATQGKAEGFDEYGVGRKRKLAPGEQPQPKPAPTVAPKADKVREPIRKTSREEPQLGANEVSANGERQEPSLGTNSHAATKKSPARTSSQDATDVLILYVLLPEGEEINGALLLPSLLTLGFKYGEMNIFHRHQDNAGTGEVMFSLANMFNPGTFDLENMDKLQTRGLSLFMTLPGPADALQTFNLMHNAAKKLADEFGGQILDGQRTVLNIQTTRNYVERIREFQRHMAEPA